MAFFGGSAIDGWVEPAVFSNARPVKTGDQVVDTTERWPHHGYHMLSSTSSASNSAIPNLAVQGPNYRRVLGRCCLLNMGAAANCGEIVVADGYVLSQYQHRLVPKCASEAMS